MTRRARRLRTWIVTCAALLATAPALAFAQTGADKGFIWQVERGGRIGWLVGSLHVLTSDYYPLPEAIERAFARAATLVEETDITELTSPETLALLASKGTYPGTDTLAAHVPPAAYSLVLERLSRAGIPGEAVRRMRPWMAALTLFTLELQRAGFAAEHGIDLHFRRRIDGSGKTFQALETPAEQIEYLASLPDDVQRDLLRTFVDDADAQIREVATIASAWRRGDTDVLERVLLDTLTDAPAVYQSLIVQRNLRWLPAIESCLQRDGCFIVVGAAHVVGPDGLVALLRQRGYSVGQQ
jgi:uncharacterized protein